MTDEDPHEAGRRSPAYATAMDEMKLLEPGEVLTYFVVTGFERRCRGTFAAAWDAYEQGLVSLAQRRRDDGSLAYLAVRV